MAIVVLLMSVLLAVFIWLAWNILKWVPWRVTTWCALLVTLLLSEMSGEIAPTPAARALTLLWALAVVLLPIYWVLRPLLRKSRS